MSGLPEAVADAMPPDDEMVIGTVTSGNPLVINARGADINGVGRLASAGLAAGDPVALLRQDNTWLALGKIIGATGTGLGLTNLRHAVCNTITPLVNAEADLPGTSISFTTTAPNALLLALWVCYYESVGVVNTIGIAKLRVDGVTNISPQAVFSNAGLADSEATIPACTLLTIQPGSHTVILRANRVGGADGNLRIDNLHTTLTIATFE